MSEQLTDYERAKSTSSKLPTTEDTTSFYTLIVDPDASDDIGFDAEQRYIPFDFVKGVNSSLSSDITSYPLMNGDVLSDHMYTKPKSISLEAIFSLNGKGVLNGFFGSGTDRLMNIEAYFETLQKMGRTMTLIAVTNTKDKNGNITSTGDRFLRTPNLVISASRYTYGYNTLEVSLTLTEVYFFDSGEISVWEDEGDPNLPSVKDFEQLDFSQDVLTDEAVYDLVIQELSENGLISRSWAEWFADYGKAILATLASAAAIVLWIILKAIAICVLKMSVAAITSMAVTASLGATIGALASNPVTLIGAAAVVIVVGVTMFIRSIFRAVKRAQLINKFEYHDGDDEANRDEYNRLMIVCNNVQQAFSDYANNNNLMFYSMNSNKNKIDAYLTIDSIIYDFYFETNSEGMWTVTVTSINNVPMLNATIMKGNSNVLELKKDDCLFKGTDGSRVYLINKGYAYQDLDEDSIKQYLENLWKSGGCTFLGYTAKEQQESKENPPTDELYNKFRNDGIYKDLTQFVFLVTDQNVEKITKKLKDTLYNCLKKKAYE